MTQQDILDIAPKIVNIYECYRQFGASAYPDFETYLKIFFAEGYSLHKYLQD